MRSWRLLTNHMYVLLCVAKEPDIRIRDVAVHVGITERAAQAILRDLQEAGVVEATRVGRRNTYRVLEHARFPHPLLSHSEIGPVLKVLSGLLEDA
jgi:predicted ArsR family transcriptional regulator